MDWLALWDVDPWGPGRDDIRAVVTSLWIRGSKFEDIKPTYPHLDLEGDSEDDLVAMLESDRQIAEQRLRDTDGTA